VDYISALAAEIREELDPRSLPDEPADDLLRVYAVLVLALGSAVRAEDVHNAWVAWMVPREPDHPALVPFADLDETTRNQDAPFARAIRTVAHRKGLAPGSREGV